MIPGNGRGGIVELCGSRLTPLPCFKILPVLPNLNPKKMMSNSLEAEDGPSRAGRFSKNVS